MNSATSMPRTVRLWASLVALLFCVPFSVQAQQEEWENLRKETTSFYQHGQYARSIATAKQAVRVAEKTFGAEHSNVATSLNDLALMYVNQGQYAEAELFYKRSFAIYEKTLDSDQPNFATSLSNLANLYKAENKYDQAEPLYKRSLAIFEKALGFEHKNVASVLVGLSAVYFAQDRYKLAEAASKRALAIQEKISDSDHLDVAIILNNLAQLYTSQGEYAKAEPLFKRSLAIYQKAFGANQQGVANILNNMGELYGVQGKYAQAELFLQRSLAIREKALGAEHADVALSLASLAALSRAQGQYAQAESLYKRARVITEKVFGPEHARVVTVLNQMALLYYDQAKYVQAESMFDQALTIREDVLDMDNPGVATSLNKLAGIYTAQGLYAEAEPLRKRALAILVKNFGPKHPKVASNLNDSAYQYYLQGKYAQAEPLYTRVLAIREKALGAAHREVGNTLRDLAMVYVKQGRFAQAKPLLARALTIAENSLGSEHMEVAGILYKQAEIDKALKQYAQAEPLYQRSLRIAETVLGPDHPAVVQSLNSLAEMYRLQARYAEALSLVRRASTITSEVKGTVNELALWKPFDKRSGYLNHLKLLSLNPRNASADAIADEALQIFQLEQSATSDSGIDKIAARLASANNELGELVKRKQDAAERASRDQAQLFKVVSKVPQQYKAADERRLRNDIAQMAIDIAKVDAELIQRFPDYQKLTRRKPLSVKQIQARLKPGEALLVYALGKNSLLWVVKADAIVFMPIKAKLKDVTAKVASIRAKMHFDKAGRTRPVRVDTLHKLYQTLFAPALPHLIGLSHIMIVPTGPLQSLPFSMLVASPSKRIRHVVDYRQVDWLARHFALSVMPSVRSLQMIRQPAKAALPAKMIAESAAPLEAVIDVVKTNKQSKIDADSTSEDQPANAQAPTVAEVEAVHLAASLLEATEKLTAMPKTPKPDQKLTWLRENLTETKLKHLNLAQYRTIAFANQCEIAGEFNGVVEPGLTSPPPRQRTAEDDGYLAASEIAKLKLNADWVVLPTCNTAAAHGTPGAEGLNRLSKAFFYAGAHSLLISNWPVASTVTERLTRAMFRQYQAKSESGKAEAYRKAMMELLNLPDHPEYAHPLFWAAFDVVGEGGESAIRPN